MQTAAGSKPSASQQRQEQQQQQQQQHQVTVAVQYNNQLYDRIRCLGRGSFGTAVVYRRRADCSLVVLKEIDLLNFRGEREKCSAINEARIMSKLSHNNIIRYYNAYTTDTKLIIEMEYASLGTLASYLSLQVQPLSEQEVLIIFRQIACGLSYLHSKKIIHLDLKMANIFVNAEGLVKIGDFGIAQYISDKVSHQRASVATGELATGYRRKQQHHTKRDSSHLGTLAYSSPEQCLGEPTSYKSDIWSLGCILYELITRKPLFASNNLSDLLISITRIQLPPITENISPSLRYLFELMISRDPQQRPNAVDLLRMLDQLLSQIELLKRKLQVKRSTHRFDVSSGVALLAAQNQDNLDQISYLHSLVYQIRLDTKHIQVERVNLPQSKRIKEMCKGKSHFLVLTYDSVVYGWGSRAHGQLGACGLNTNSSVSRDRSTCSSIDSKANPGHHLLGHNQLSVSQTISAASSLASSTQTIIPTHHKRLSVSTSCQQMTKELIMNQLNLSEPIARPIVINELNNRRIVQVAAGKNFSVFLSKTGIVMTCGDGSSGCLGRGDHRSNYTPKMVECLLSKDVVYIACGPQHVVAVCGNGQAYAWGKNKNGRLGIGTGGEPAPRYVLSPLPVIFSPHVHIKSAFCADKCTVFIDFDNRCWACGENRFNRLGLDTERKWRTKTVVVDRKSTPQQIKPLRKYQIVSCSIGRNHASFVTDEGKLIVLGRDIDYSNKFKTASQESSLGKKLPLNLYNNNSTNHIESQKSIREPIDSKRASNLSLPPSAYRNRMGIFLKLARKQRQSYLKRSRLMKKMPLESVLGVACTSRFTLALTNNNRIYFWGVRSYDHSDEEGSLNHQRTRKSPLEPQLVLNSHEECFVKIGTTNSSLMRDIQALGSDQPIIHAQDPKLMAKTLSDLWILDYKLDNHCLSTGVSSECSLSSSLSSNSYCSLCSCCNSTLDNSCQSTSQKSLNSTSPSNTRHDAILEPQPIISLYVPSMFNHNRCSLQMADLFCDGQDKFYLVLDTTIKPLQNQSRPSSTQPHSFAAGRYGVNTRRTQSFPASRMNLNHEEDNSDGGEMVKVDIHFDRELVNNDSLNELPEVVINQSSSSSKSQEQQRGLAVPEVRGGLSFEEPRSFSTFVSSLDHHIVMGLSNCSASNGAPMMPLVFDDVENSRIILDEDEKTAQNSNSKSEVSNTNAETSSMPSWVKNEFIQCQMNNNQDLSIEVHEESLSLERPPIFMANSLVEAQQLEQVEDAADSIRSYTFGPETASNTSQRTLDGELFKCDLNHSFRNTKTTVSRSQPDICDTSADATSGANPRRASILLTERCEPDTANLLQCNVYQSKYLNNEFNSTTTQLHYNSESHLNSMQPVVVVGDSHRTNRTKNLQISGSAQVVDQLEMTELHLKNRLNGHKAGEQMIWSSWSSRLPMLGAKGLRKGSSYKMDVGGKKPTNSYSSSSYSLRKSLLKLFC